MHINDEEISTEARSDHERLVINDYHWWTPDELEKQLTLFFLKIYPRSSPSLKRPAAN